MDLPKCQIGPNLLLITGQFVHESGGQIFVAMRGAQLNNRLKKILKKLKILPPNSQLGFSLSAHTAPTGTIWRHGQSLQWSRGKL